VPTRQATESFVPELPRPKALPPLVLTGLLNVPEVVVCQLPLSEIGFSVRGNVVE
jgi:hypothetical protein